MSAAPGECVSPGLCAAEMEKGNKAALLHAGGAAPPPPWRRQPGLAPALLPACECHARPVISVGSLRLTSAEQSEGSGPGIELNKGSSDVFIL